MISLLSGGVESLAQRWVATDITELATGDVIAIVDVTSSRAMSNNNGTSAAPTATSVTLNADKSEIVGEVDATLQWKITTGSGTYSFSKADSDIEKLYCTKTNNGVRVGSTNSNTAFTWDESGYLKNVVAERYVGMYNNQDWRCYTSINDNIKSTVTKFFKKIDVEVDPCTVNFSVNGEVSTVTEEKGGAGVMAPAVAEVTGWSFVGWSTTDVANTSERPELVALSNGVFYPKENTTLYAVYKNGEDAAEENLTMSYESHEGWTIAGYEATKYWVLDEGAQIISPALDNVVLKSIKVKARTYGGTNYKQIDIVAGDVEIGSIIATGGTTMKEYEITDINKTISGSLVFSSSTNAKQKGPGISEITIVYGKSGSGSVVYSSSPVVANPSFSIVAKSDMGLCFATSCTPDYPVTFTHNYAYLEDPDNEEFVTMAFVVNNLTSSYDIDDNPVTVLDINPYAETGVYHAGDIIPANTPLLFMTFAGSMGGWDSDEEVTPCTVEYLEAKEGTPIVFDGGNYLKGVKADGSFDYVAGNKYYKLAYRDYEAQTGLGFFFGAADGGSFMGKPGTCVLELPATASAANHVLLRVAQKDATGIGQAPALAPAAGREGIFTLTGVRVNGSVDALPQGIYVVNGKKVMVK